MLALLSAPAFGLPIFLFDFYKALFLIVIIIDFIQAYRIFFPEIIGSRLIAFIIATIATFTLFIPYEWTAWAWFFGTFAYAFFIGFQPWTWAKSGSTPIEDEEYFHYYGAGEGEE